MSWKWLVLLVIPIVLLVIHIINKIEDCGFLKDEEDTDD